MHVDRGPCFKIDEWNRYLQITRINRSDSGIETHNAHGADRTYHDFLRRICRKVRVEHPNILKEKTLSLAEDVRNCTTEPKGLSSKLPVFGVKPQLPVGLTDLPEQRQSMKVLKSARDEILKNALKSLLMNASNLRTPISTDHDIAVGSYLLVYSENSRN